jgi:hypothetical protein
MSASHSAFSWRCIRSFALALTVLGVSIASEAAVFVSVAIAPPPLPVYAQPICPGPGYIWIPGYWAYGPDGYYWVPGTWVLAPYVGALWTPGYWGWANGVYIWRSGYWGPRVGFYGGINYGFGYFGVGYHGGYWRDGAFYYNRAVNNVNVTRIHNTYSTTVVNNASVNRVSYNGGAGGVTANATAQEEAFARQTHRGPTQAQLTHEWTASSNRGMLASVNQGQPSIATTPRAGAFARAGATNSGPGERRTNGHVQGQSPPGQAQMLQSQPPSPRGHAHSQPQGQMHPQGQPHAQSQGQPQGQHREGEGRGEGSQHNR